MRLRHWIAGALLGLAGNAHAVMTIYQFSFDVTGPESAANTHLGTVAWDNATLTGSGPEQVLLLDFDFTFSGTTYTGTNDVSAMAWFDSGVLLGIAYLAGDAGLNQISFTPGFLDTTDAVFSYDMATGAGDNGSSGILFSVVGQTPEPPTWASFVLAGIIGGVVWRRRRRG